MKGKIIVGVVGVGVVTVIAVALARARGAPELPEMEYTRIYGYIRDVETGEPIPLVRPELAALRLVGEVSDGSGIYRIDNVPYPAGQTATYEVTFIPTWELPNPQYEAATRSVTVGELATTRLDVELKCTWRPPITPPVPPPPIEEASGHIEQVMVEGILLSDTVLDISGKFSLHIRVLCRNDSLHTDIKGRVFYNLGYPEALGVGGSSGSIPTPSSQTPYVLIPPGEARWAEGDIGIFTPEERSGIYELGLTLQSLSFMLDSQGKEIWWKIAERKSLDTVVYYLQKD